ncbi:hypothetical protein [Falsirhodobacter sp. alg1]|uniref:hypothetical protein n=1 Tax=Falsirhodobacter sp. alg1 TaxID=1472418 RepID=UPI0005EE7ACA|nr:hypothetical protein [Falsirhodobacter sp. alg1]
MPRITLLTLSMALMAGSAAFAQAVPQRVNFPEGATHVTLEGQAAPEAVRYVVNAGEGQILDINLVSPDMGACFTLYTPDSADKAAPTFTGGCNGQSFSAMLSETGDYTVAVAAAPGIEAAAYSLVISATNDAVEGAPVLPAN